MTQPNVQWCARAMPRAKKGQKKVPIFNKTTGFAPLGVITPWSHDKKYVCFKTTFIYVVFRGAMAFALAMKNTVSEPRQGMRRAAFTTSLILLLNKDDIKNCADA